MYSLSGQLMSMRKKSTDKNSLRWAKRGKDAFKNENQSLFGIVQGGEYSDLRKFSAEETVKLGFDGYYNWGYISLCEE